MSRPVRCGWAAEASLQLQRYHDDEWGVPARDDRVQFEFLVLESAQAGLSWTTILGRREGYRRAFAGFDPEVVSRFDAGVVEQLLGDPGIIRNRAKVEAAVNNAARFLEVRREFGSFWSYLEGFAAAAAERICRLRDEEIPPTSPGSDALAADMKRRGFRFVGSTILYAHMQATGVVNDHLVGCFRHAQLCRRRHGTRPGRTTRRG